MGFLSAAVALCCISGCIFAWKKTDERINARVC